MSAPDLADAAPPQDDALTRCELAGLMAEFFRLVSFADGSYPRYAQVRPLFMPGGLLVRGTEEVPHVQTVEQFTQEQHPEVRSGELTQFDERELSAYTQVFGHVAQRFSHYRKSGVYRGRGFVEHGIISTQFVQGLDGWRISAMAWDDERPGLALPPLPHGGAVGCRPWPAGLRRPKSFPV